MTMTTAAGTTTTTAAGTTTTGAVSTRHALPGGLAYWLVRLAALERNAAIDQSDVTVVDIRVNLFCCSAPAP